METGHISDCLVCTIQTAEMEKLFDHGVVTWDRLVPQFGDVPGALPGELP